MHVTSLEKALSFQDHSKLGLNMDLNIYILLTLGAKIYYMEKRLIQQVPVHTFNHIVLQSIAKTSIHTKKKIQSSGTGLREAAHTLGSEFRHKRVTIYS